MDVFTKSNAIGADDFRRLSAAGIHCVINTFDVMSVFALNSLTWEMPSRWLLCQTSWFVSIADSKLDCVNIKMPILVWSGRNRTNS